MLVCFARFVAADPWSLSDPQPAANVRYGTAVAVDGKQVLVTRMFVVPRAEPSVAYVFDLGSRAIVETFTDPERGVDDGFGQTAAMNDRWAAIASPRSATVYVFERGTSNGRAVRAPGVDVHGEFGMAMVLHGNRLLVGSPLARSVGRVYAFDLSTGELTATLDDPSPTGADLFGASLAVSDRWIAVGAPADASTKARSGQVHLYDARSLAPMRTIDDPTPSRFDLFGDSVDVDEKHVLVGASGDRTTVGRDGEVHLFDAESGRYLRSFADPTPSAVERYGRPVRLAGASAFVGACADDTQGNDVGQVYRFDVDTGVWTRTFDDPRPSGNDFFGMDFATDARVLVVGAPSDETGAAGTAETWVFDLVHGNEADVRP